MCEAVNICTSWWQSGHAYL